MRVCAGRRFGSHLVRSKARVRDGCDGESEEETRRSMVHSVSSRRSARLVAFLALAMAMGGAGCGVAIGDDGEETGSALGSLRPSAHGGMGATLYDGGVGFRLFAPFARRVWVAGDFNGWSSDAHE